LWRIKQLLHQLVVGEGLDERQVVILGTHRKRKSCLAGEGRLGNFRVIKLGDEHGPHRIVYSTIHRFKGLEADVVILVDVKFNAIDPHLYYVGATRAKHRLFVLGW
jgi:DNA helicase IV